VGPLEEFFNLMKIDAVFVLNLFQDFLACWNGFKELHQGYVI